jgi:hypothetical protein
MKESERVLKGRGDRVRIGEGERELSKGTVRESEFSISTRVYNIYVD